MNWDDRGARRGLDARVGLTLTAPRKCAVSFAGRLAARVSSAKVPCGGYAARGRPPDAVALRFARVRDRVAFVALGWPRDLASGFRLRGRLPPNSVGQRLLGSLWPHIEGTPALVCGRLARSAAG